LGPTSDSLGSSSKSASSGRAFFAYEVYFRKKMNFTTDLPKKNPIVSYIVASAVKCEKYFPEGAEEGPVFRMHAVILTRRTRGGKGEDSSS
jgi:hypothetical protein